MNSNSQALLDTLKENHPDIIGFSAMKATSKKVCALQLLSTDKNVDNDALKAYLEETLVHFQERSPFTVLRYLAHLDAKHVEICIVYKQMSFLFLSTKEKINEVLLQEVCSDFCEQIYSTLQQSVQNSIHSFTNTYNTKKSSPRPPSPPKTSHNAVETLLREQSGIRVNRVDIDNKASVVHYIAQKNLGQYAQSELLQSRQSMLQQLNSKLVLSHFDFQGGQIKVTRPFVNGRSMAELIKSRKKLELTQALAIIRKLIDLLKPLHEHGFAHGNIHPHNVFFSSEREVLLTDDYLFDLISSPKFIRKSYAREYRVPVGLLGYLAPEQLLGECATPQSDFWSLGYLFCYLILGEPVLSFRTPSEQIVAAHHSIKEALKERVLVDYPFTKLFLEGLLHEKPAKRIQSIHVLLEQIIEIMDQAKD